jgi:5-methylcytosine-specific restriction endonuclease McrA
MNICKCCNTEFIPIGYSKKNAHKQRFCSRSCSNKIVIRKELPQKDVIQFSCIFCGKKAAVGRKFCPICIKEERHRFHRKHRGKLLHEITIKEYSITMRGGANKFDSIRGHARKAYIQSGKPKQCFNCGYNKHFEVCHIHPISNFPETATIADVNSEKNLIALCPNCHWELDKGLLKL